MSEEISLLPERLKKEWYKINEYYSIFTKEKQYMDFKNKWNDFKGKEIDEFLSVSYAIIKEWDFYGYKNYSYSNIESNKPFSEIWNKFKLYWQLDSKESNTMIKEMELLSDNMLREWRYKYNFTYTYVYEDYNIRYDDLIKKNKSELWNEFKTKWDIDPNNYDENMYEEMENEINKIENELSDTNFKEYPKNFYDYREDANYHSYDSYSILEKYEICKDWETYCDNKSECLSECSY